MLSEHQSTEIKRASDLIKKSRKTIAFTGAGISVESGIPDFRGPNGVWSKIDTRYLEITYFKHHAEVCWPIIYKTFFKHVQSARPNPAHEILAWMEQRHLISGIITQNIDNLHHKAGSKKIIEFHGNTRLLVCLSCGHHFSADFRKLGQPPRCPQCGTILKPDFVFFGEGIPYTALEGTRELLTDLEVMIVIGTTGMVFPAGQIPRQAKRNGTKIIEINLTPSTYTHEITNIFIPLAASQALSELKTQLVKPSPSHRPIS